MSAKNIDNGQIYDLVNQVRIELKGDIIRLETKFDTLEAGRLTRLEAQVNKQQVAQATFATKFAIVGFITSSVVGAAIGAIMIRILN